MNILMTTFQLIENSNYYKVLDTAVDKSDNGRTSKDIIASRYQLYTGIYRYFNVPCEEGRPIPSEAFEDETKHHRKIPEDDKERLRLCKCILDILVSWDYKQGKFKYATWSKVYNKYMELIRGSIFLQSELIDTISALISWLRDELDYIYGTELNNLKTMTSQAQSVEISKRHQNRLITLGCLEFLLYKPLFVTEEDEPTELDLPINKISPKDNAFMRAKYMNIRGSFMCDILKIIYDEELDFNETLDKIFKMFVPNIKDDELNVDSEVYNRQSKNNIFSIIYKGFEIYVKLLKYPSSILRRDTSEDLTETLYKGMKVLFENFANVCLINVADCNYAMRFTINSPVYVTFENPTEESNLAATTKTAVEAWYNTEYEDGQNDDLIKESLSKLASSDESNTRSICKFLNSAYNTISNTEKTNRSDPEDIIIDDKSINPTEFFGTVFSNDINREGYLKDDEQIFTYHKINVKNEIMPDKYKALKDDLNICNIKEVMTKDGNAIIMLSYNNTGFCLVMEEFARHGSIDISAINYDFMSKDTVFNTQLNPYMSDTGITVKTIFTRWLIWRYMYINKVRRHNCVTNAPYGTELECMAFAPDTILNTLRFKKNSEEKIKAIRDWKSDIETVLTDSKELVLNAELDSDKASDIASSVIKNLSFYRGMPFFMGCGKTSILTEPATKKESTSDDSEKNNNKTNEEEPEEPQLLAIPLAAGTYIIDDVSDYDTLINSIFTKPNKRKYSKGKKDLERWNTYKEIAHSFNMSLCTNEILVLSKRNRPSYADDISVSEYILWVQYENYLPCTLTNDEVNAADSDNSESIEPTDTDQINQDDECYETLDTVPDTNQTNQNTDTKTDNEEIDEVYQSDTDNDKPNTTETHCDNDELQQSEDSSYNDITEDSPAEIPGDLTDNGTIEDTNVDAEEPQTDQSSEVEQSQSEQQLEKFNTIEGQRSNTSTTNAPTKYKVLNSVIYRDGISYSRGLLESIVLQSRVPVSQKKIKGKKSKKQSLDASINKPIVPVLGQEYFERLMYDYSDLDEIEGLETYEPAIDLLDFIGRGQKV